jgi:hypothetical protein
MRFESPDASTAAVELTASPEVGLLKSLRQSGMCHKLPPVRPPKQGVPLDKRLFNELLTNAFTVITVVVF